MLLAIDTTAFQTIFRPDVAVEELVAALQLPAEKRREADLDRICEALQEVAFFRSFPRAKLLKICRMGALLQLHSGDPVFVEGDVGHHFFALVKGAVDILVKEKAPPYNQIVVNSVVNKGSFGELALMEVRAPAASARNEQAKRHHCKRPALRVAWRLGRSRLHCLALDGASAESCAGGRKEVG